MLHCEELSHGIADTVSGGGEPALIFLHGFLGDGQTWKQIADGCGRSAWAIDLPGHGRSNVVPSTSQDPFSDVATAFWQLVEERGVELVDLVGYSMGGRLAMHIALERPDKVRRLVLESAHPGLEAEVERHQRVQADAEWAKRIRNDWPQVVQAWHEQSVFTSLKGSHLQSELMAEKQTGDPFSLSVALELFSTGRQNPLADRLSTLPMPVLFVSGEMDTRYCEIGERLVSRPGPIHHYIQKDAGHVVHREQPEAYLHVLKQFIQG
ncbi:MAG: 2-succinyl-6-hydroxy-2,4-cyclohexadiene-1-carboxylate synthase [Bacteroidetes bacterium]|nr:2-succinyl-6-hydroxy-2,4-cyclohexadiene-1-carboxylate synthase [Bacteroidota bacterium]